MRVHHRRRTVTHTDDTTERPTFAEAAQFQIAWYREALIGAGLRPGAEVRTLAALTTGGRKNDEVIELTICEARGYALPWRCRPFSPVHERGTRHHGLKDGDLQQLCPLGDLRAQLEADLTRPGPNGQPVPLVTWDAPQLRAALSRSFQAAGQQEFALPLVGLEEILHAVDDRHPEFMYHFLSLGKLRWLAPCEKVDRRRATSAAQATRQLVGNILAGQSCRLPPDRYD